MENTQEEIEQSLHSRDWHRYENQWYRSFFGFDLLIDILPEGFRAHVSTPDFDIVYESVFSDLKTASLSVEKAFKKWMLCRLTDFHGAED